MTPWLLRIARLVGAAAGTLAGLVAVQLLRLRRMEFLPGHPGFYVNHVVPAPGGRTDEPRIRFAVLGDSTVAGVGVDRAEDSLPYLVAERLAAREQRPVHVVSFGWAGARVADLLADQLPRASRPLRRAPDPFLPGAEVVLVVIGANDATHNTPPRRYRAELRAALAAIAAAAPGALVVLAGIPAFRGAVPAIEPLILLADLYGRLLRPISRDEARRAGAAFADLAGDVPPRIVPGTDVLSTDRFHPSRAGYELWADVIAEAYDRGPVGAPAAQPAGLERARA